MLIADQLDRYLMLERARPPVGVAPPAGHALDEHSSYLQAAVDEVAEEVGLTVQIGDLDLVYDQWIGNRCRRIPHDPPGHHWKVYRARTWSGQLTPSSDETNGVRWSSRNQLQDLTERTAAWTRGEITDTDYTEAPGLEPVWVTILAALGAVTVHPDDLQRVLAVAETPPVTTPQ